MKILQATEARNHFSSVLRDIEAGDEVVISFGKKRQAIAVIIPYEKWKKNQKRQLGTLEGKMTVEFADDFFLTDEELMSLRRLTEYR